MTQLTRRAFVAATGLLCLSPARLLSAFSKKSEPDETVLISQEGFEDDFTFELQRYGKRFCVFFVNAEFGRIELPDLSVDSEWKIYHLDEDRFAATIRFAWKRNDYGGPDFWWFDYYMVGIKDLCCYDTFLTVDGSRVRYFPGR